MKFLEKDLEEIIFEQMQTLEGRLSLVDKGLWHGFPTKFKSQLRIGNYGVADIVTLTMPSYEGWLNGGMGFHIDKPIINIIELKKDNVSMSTFLQSIRYWKGISSWINKNKKIEYDYRITLIGSKVDNKSDFVYLTDFIRLSDNIGLDYYEYSYGLDGIKFKKISNYSLVDEGFKS